MDAKAPLEVHDEEVPTSLLEARRPSLHLREVVETYMVSKKSGLDGSIHKALNTNDPRVRLDQRKHEWVETEVEEVSLETLYKDIEGDEKRFIAAIEDYERKAKPKYRIGIDMTKAHSMDDVMEAIEDAKMVYDKTEQGGFFVRLRRVFRRLAEKQEACDAWLKLLPGDSQYFSIICGGLRLILGAATRVRKINDAIVDALIRIPTILSKSRRVLAINKASSKLSNYCAALYVAVLNALGHMLHYYKGQTFPHAFRVLIEQGSFQQELLEKVDAITQCSDAVDQEANLCEMERNKQTNQVTKTTEKVTKQVYKITGATQEKLGELSLKTGDTYDSVEDLRRMLYSEADQRAREASRKEIDRAEDQQRTDNLLSALNKISVLLEQSPQLREPVGKKDNCELDGTPPCPDASRQLDRSTVRKLLFRLSYNKSILRNDMRENLRHAMNLSLGEQDIAVYMMRSTKLQDWLRIPRSSVLMVNNVVHSSASYRSPLGFVCAKLVNAIRQASKPKNASLESTVINLHFFCGEHTDWRDTLDNGPAGVINSLLAQLLTHYQDFDRSIIKFLKNLEPDDTESLGNIFGKLLAQLSISTMVFCTIDGLSFYTDEERSEDCERLLGKLIRLTRRLETKGGCVFKLLLTVPSELRLSAIDDLDQEDEVLRIPEGLEKMGGFTEMKWDISAGQAIAAL